MSNVEELKRMVMTFRVSELVTLLAYAGRNKTGRKQELQARAIELAKSRATSVHTKIRELYKTIQSQTNVEPGGGGVSAGMNQPSSGLSANNGARPPTYSYSQAALHGRSSFTPSYMPDYPNKTSSPTVSGSKLPTHPDVKLKPLPFFDILGELMKPTSLSPTQMPGKGYNDGAYSFHLTPQQADEIARNHDGRPGVKLEYPVQIQMRLCLLETSCPQDDHFPPNISVRVNNKTCPLPNPIPSTKQGVEPRRPPKPVNITHQCRISPVQGNTVHVMWSSELGRAYCISIYLVRRLSSQDLLARLKARGVKNADFTRGLIKEKLSEGSEDEIATTSLKCSLQCPLGKCRMQIPCRATTCTHLQCFDASLYIQMNERKPTWVCPVCDKPALYERLVIDGYFADILKETASSCMDITLHKDGSWKEVSKKAKEAKPKEEKSDVNIETLEDDSGSDEVKVTEERGTSSSAGSGAAPAATPSSAAAGDTAAAAAAAAKTQKEPVCVDLTLSDSEDEAQPPPPPKKRHLLTGAGAGAGSAAEGKWQATAVGETRLKLSFSGSRSNSVSSAADTAAPASHPTTSTSTSSLAALQSISMSPGGLSSTAAPPPYYPSSQSGSSNMSYLGLMSPGGYTHPTSGLTGVGGQAWRSFLPGGSSLDNLFSPTSAAPASGAQQPPQPPPSSSPDVISLD